MAGEISSAVDFTGHVLFDSGQALCTARLVCGGENSLPDGGTICGALDNPCPIN